MLTSPQLYDDNISFHHINAPFNVLFSNNNLILNRLSNVLKNPDIDYSMLLSKYIQTNGVNEYFFIETIEDVKTVQISNYQNTILSYVQLYKSSDLDNNEYTPLTFSEVKNYMESLGYIKYIQTFSFYLDSNNISHSNLMSVATVKNDGVEKDTEVVIDNIDIKTIYFNRDSNQLLSLDELSLKFINKNNYYSLKVSSDFLSSVESVDTYILKDVTMSNYDKNLSDEYYVSSTQDLTEVIPTKTNVGNLKISSPMLNEPINLDAFNKRGDSYISLSDKKADSIYVTRKDDMQDNSVLTISETEKIVKNALLKINNVSIENFDDFEALYQSVCSLNDYLKLSLMVDSDKGYVNNFTDNVDAVLNHNSFSTLLTKKKKDKSENIDKVYRANQYFHEILSAKDKEKFIKIAESLSVSIDFYRDSFGSIFEALCYIAGLLQYPTFSMLKSIQDIQSSTPLNIYQFIIINPVIMNGVKNNSEYYLNIPVYVKENVVYELNKPYMNYNSKNNYPYFLSVPIYNKPDHILFMENPNINRVNKYMYNYSSVLSLVEYKAEFNLDNVLGKQINLFESFSVRLRGKKNDVCQYAFISSDRALNKIEYIDMYKKVLNNMDDDLNYYMCRSTVVSKDVAALIITSNIFAMIESKYPTFVIPLDIIKSSIKLDTEKTSYSKSDASDYNVKCVQTIDDSEIVSIITDSTTTISTASFVFDSSSCRGSEILLDGSVSCNIDNYILSDNNIENLVDFLDSSANKYYNDSNKKLSVNFQEEDSVDIDDFTKFFYCNDSTCSNIDSISNGDIDLGYGVDLIKNAYIGDRDNSVCPAKVKTSEDNPISDYVRFYTFIPVYGDDTTMPTTKEEQLDNLLSEVSGVYYVIPNSIDAKTIIHEDELKTFYKRKKTYIATSGEETFYIYLSVSDKKIYSTVKGLDVSVETNNDITSLNINKLKIYLNENIDSIDVEELDGCINDFDFSFIRDLSIVGGYGSNNSFSGWSSIVPKTDSLSEEDKKNTSLPTKVVLPKSDDDPCSKTSGANLDRVGSIASPACCPVVDPDKDIIPGAFTSKLTIDAVLVTYTKEKKKKVFDIKQTINFSYGIIDGYYNDDYGELLVNANDNEEVDNLLSSVDFEVDNYECSSDKDIEYVVEYINDSDDAIKRIEGPKKIKFDLEKFKNSLRDLDGNSLPLYSDEGKEIDITDLPVYVNKRVSDEGLYVTDFNVEVEQVKIKAVTKNKYTPIALAHKDDVLKLIKTKKENSSNSNYKNYYYLDGDSLEAIIHLTPDLLYNTGTKLVFNEEA